MCWFVFFFKPKTAYEMRISDWSSDVCSSDLPEVFEKIDWDDSRNTSRTRKRIGRSLVLWRPATHRALRGKAAPTIVADEIDAYAKKVRDAIMTLVTSRQEEFGNAAKAYLCSHPDAGPDEIGRAHV